MSDEVLELVCGLAVFMFAIFLAGVAFSLGWQLAS